jgi:DNA-binding CsgD family transcriptional regulator
VVTDINWHMLVLQQMARVGLTPTEQRIALELLRARSNAEIGLALGMAERTVTGYLYRMMQKTNTHNPIWSGPGAPTGRP